MKTQKALGLQALNNCYKPLHGAGYVPSFSVHNPADLLNTDHKYTINFPVFARPCPVRPRHGFVDSRICNTIAELERVASETLAADPEGEIIIMNPLSASHSAILQNGRITVGPGNDGATAGKDAISYVLRHGIQYDSDLYSKANIKNSPYFELVYERFGYYNHTPAIVQLRDGPSVPSTVDNIPADMTVEHVITVDNQDLLEWERLILDAPANTVVYHPGGALSSHYSIHAIARNIPVLISRKPEIGEQLTKLEESESAPIIDWQELRRGFKTACITRPIQFEAGIFTMLAVSKLMKSPDSFTLGLGMGFAFRLAITACLGERRHQNKRKRKLSRDYIYERAWDRVERLKSKLPALVESFKFGYWASGFGGRAWETIAQFAFDLYQSVAKGESTAALLAFNNLVDAQHNNSWFGDKFVEKRVFTDAGYGHYDTAIWAAPTLYRLTKQEPHAKWNWRAFSAINRKAVRLGLVKVA